MAKRRGRPGNGGKRKPCGRLRARAVLVDYGNPRVQAMRAAFAMFRGGRAGNELGDPIGKAWAAGLLDGFGADPVAMRDAGRDFGQLWRLCYGDLQIRTHGAERSAGRAAGARLACGAAPTAAERRFERMRAILAAHDRNSREAFYGLCVDYQDSDAMPPFVERLINRQRVQVGAAAGGTMPVRGDRERLVRAVALLEALVAGERRCR